MLQGSGRQVQRGGKRTVKVSLMHEYRDDIAALVNHTSKALQRMRAITERWSARQRRTLLLTRLLRRWLGGKWLPGLPPEAELLPTG